MYFVDGTNYRIQATLHMTHFLLNSE